MEAEVFQPDGTSTYESGSEGIGQVSQALPDDSAFPWDLAKEHCRATSYAEFGEAADWVVAWPFLTGTGYFTKSDTVIAKTHAASYRGVVHFRVRYRTGGIKAIGMSWTPTCPLETAGGGSRRTPPTFTFSPRWIRPLAMGTICVERVFGKSSSAIIGPGKHERHLQQQTLASSRALRIRRNRPGSSPRRVRGRHLSERLRTIELDHRARAHFGTRFFPERGLVRKGRVGSDGRLVLDTAVGVRDRADRGDDNSPSVDRRRRRRVCRRGAP